MSKRNDQNRRQRVRAWSGPVYGTLPGKIETYGLRRLGLGFPYRSRRELCRILFQRKGRSAFGVEHFQHHTAAAGDAGQRVVGDINRQTGFLGNQAVDVFQ